MTKGKIYKWGMAHADVQEVLEACEDVFEANLAELKAKTRIEPIPSIRAIVYNCMLERGLNYEFIAEKLGRNHTNIVYHAKQHEGRLQGDRDYAASWEAIHRSMEKKNEVKNEDPLSLIA